MNAICTACVLTFLKHFFLIYHFPPYRVEKGGVCRTMSCLINDVYRRVMIEPLILTFDLMVKVTTFCYII